MPLIKSSSKKARQANIKAEIDSGRPIKQAVAIGYSEQRRASAHQHSKQKLDHRKVGDWVRGDRKHYA